MYSGQVFRHHFLNIPSPFRFDPYCFACSNYSFETALKSHPLSRRLRSSKLQSYPGIMSHHHWIPIVLLYDFPFFSQKGWFIFANKLPHFFCMAFLSKPYSNKHSFWCKCSPLKAPYNTEYFQVFSPFATFKIHINSTLTALAINDRCVFYRSSPFLIHFESKKVVLHNRNAFEIFSSLSLNSCFFLSFFHFDDTIIFHPDARKEKCFLSIYFFFQPICNNTIKFEHTQPRFLERGRAGYCLEM